MTKKKSRKRSEFNFNRDSHPERQSDEVFIGNASNQIEFSFDGFPNRQLTSYECIGWKTKRMGDIAYDNKGIPLGWPEIFPVFAKQSEIKKKNKSALKDLLPRSSSK